MDSFYNCLDFVAILNADENRLYQRMTALLDEDDTFINIPGMCLYITVYLYMLLESSWCHNQNRKDTFL